MEVARRAGSLRLACRWAADAGVGGQWQPGRGPPTCRGSSATAQGGVRDSASSRDRGAGGAAEAGRRKGEGGRRKADNGEPRADNGEPRAENGEPRVDR